MAHELTEYATEGHPLQPIAGTARNALGDKTLKIVADAGYSNGAHVVALEQKRTNAC